MRYNSSIEQRLANRRDQMWGRSMMGRHSTIADRRAYDPHEEKRPNRFVQFGKRLQLKRKVYQLILWMGTRLASRELVGTTQAKI